MVVFARQGVASTVRTFMFRGSMIGSDELVADLQAYYAENGSWQGVDSCVERDRLGPGTRPGHDARSRPGDDDGPAPEIG